MAIVFQYGSNCSEEQMNGEDRLRGDARFVAIAETVEDYRLAFNVYSSRRRCAAADMQRVPGEKVWGVLYDVPDYLMARESAALHQRKSFDAIEGEGTNYRRLWLRVLTPDDRILAALTYVVINPQPDLRTSLEYVRHIVTGLRDHGVSEEYIARVKSIAAASNSHLDVALRSL